MKTQLFDEFIATAKERVKFTDIQKNLYFNIGKYEEVLPRGKAQFNNLEETKQAASKIKKQALQNLYYNLIVFEKKATQNGIKVLWAENKDDALSFIKEIADERNATTIVKSKSMVTEEIHLNAFLEEMDIEVFETDLGEFIQQLDGEPPIHILTPAMHKNKHDVAKLFHEELGVDENLSPYELTKVARVALRNKFVKAEIGITGANFIIPDIGGIALTENEGNARLTVGFPKTHVVIVGIEKMVNSVDDLALLWPLLATYGTGQKITSYNTIVTGPHTLIEKDGPEEMIVILLDNGRTNILENEVMRESLQCIRCGACLNACPIYKNIAGGHGYLATYSGPIGSVITPHLQGMKKQAHLSFASSLCGACTEVCPVKINLHNLLLENRKIAVSQNIASTQEKLQWEIWTLLMKNRWMITLFGSSIKNFMLRHFIAKKWFKERSPLYSAQKSFYTLYKKYTKQHS